MSDDAVKDFTQQNIRDRQAELMGRLAQARAQVEHVQVDLRSLQRECTHPDAVDTTHMGESCRHCYDCGNCP